MQPLEEMGKYATVVIDPPWPLPGIGLEKETGENIYGPTPYAMMTIGDIRSLPISEVLLPDAMVFCWTVNKWMPKTFDILGGWGLAYSFTMTWVKNGGIQTPVSPKFNAEWCIVGRRGKPQFRDIKAFMTANVWTRGAYSEKPEEFYDLLRRVTPAPRLDIFNRRHIPGFDSWGDEAPEPIDSDMPAYYQEVLI